MIDAFFLSFRHSFETHVIDQNPISVKLPNAHVRAYAASSESSLLVPSPFARWPLLSYLPLVQGAVSHTPIS